MDLVMVNVEKCEMISGVIKKANLPPDTEEPTQVELSDDVLMNFYFVVVAICHQTSPINGTSFEGIINNKKYKGWDYLREKFLIATKENPSIVYPEFLSGITCNEFTKIIQDDAERVVLSDIEGRVKLLNDLGKLMVSSNFKTVHDIFIKSNGHIIGENGDGILQILSQFKAYSDPIRKKSLYFLSLMRNHSLWYFKDEANFGPPVDYHEIRGHLRLGSIVILDDKLKSKILEKELILEDEDIQIRNAVYKAIMLISKMTKNTPSVLHYFFWNYFRSCCKREEAHCKGCLDSCILPERYKTIKKEIKANKCIFSNVCSSEFDETKIVEPMVLTEYY